MKELGEGSESPSQLTRRDFVMSTGLSEKGKIFGRSKTYKEALQATWIRHQAKKKDEALPMYAKLIDIATSAENPDANVVHIFLNYCWALYQLRNIFWGCVFKIHVGVG
jgi:hypothetical protein